MTCEEVEQSDVEHNVGQSEEERLSFSSEVNQRFWLGQMIAAREAFESVQ